MFEKMYYRVGRIDGDYAYLIQINESGEDVDGAEEKCVARALLPLEMKEDSELVYEMLSYEIRK